MVEKKSARDKSRDRKVDELMASSGTDVHDCRQKRYVNAAKSKGKRDLVTREELDALEARIAALEP